MVNDQIKQALLAAALGFTAILLLQAAHGAEPEVMLRRDAATSSDVWPPNGWVTLGDQSPGVAPWIRRMDSTLPLGTQNVCRKVVDNTVVYAVACASPPQSVRYVCKDNDPDTVCNEIVIPGKPCEPSYGVKMVCAPPEKFERESPLGLQIAPTVNTR